MNLGNIQQDGAIRIAAIVAILMAFSASLVVMGYDFIVHGSTYQLPSIVNTVITSVITFAVAALSSHQGASIQQAGQATGAQTVAQTTVAAATALEKVNNSVGGQPATQAVVENTRATEANTRATEEHN